MQHDLDLVAGGSLSDLDRLPYMDIPWCQSSSMKAASVQFLRAAALCHTTDVLRDK